MVLESTLYDVLIRGFLPQRFSALAIGIEILGIIVSFLICYFAYKGYKLTTEKRYKYFSYGFLFLGLNFLSHVILNILVNMDYVQYFVEREYTPVILSLFGIYYLFLIAVMLAYMLLAMVYSEAKSQKWTWLFFFWAIVIGTYAFRDQTTFNLFSAIPLSFIVFITFEKYLQTKNKNLLFTSMSFLCLFLFHVLVLIELINKTIYIVRYLILLVGLILLLITLLKIFYGRKKK